jgi:hypothetical protein
LHSPEGPETIAFTRNRETPMTDTEHPGLPVAGYAPTQSAAAVAAVNLNKELEELVLRRLDEMVTMEVDKDALGLPVSVDKRWLAIARTHIEQGFMAMNRAIFQPGRVEGPLEKTQDYVMIGPGMGAGDGQ